MMSMELKVPYPEKDEAKRLGARWNRETRRWYVPDGVDPAPFSRWWITRENTLNLSLRAAKAYIVSAPATCWRCSAPLSVIGFLMAPGFEAQDTWESSEEGVVEDWTEQDGWGFAHYIQVLSPEIARIARETAPTYRRGYSKTVGSEYWANHCPSCKALQGDYNLFCEPGGAFMPMNGKEAASKRATRLPVPFEASGDYSLGVDFAAAIPGVPSTAGEVMNGAGQGGIVTRTIYVKPPIAEAPRRSRPRRRTWFSGLASFFGKNRKR